MPKLVGDFNPSEQVLYSQIRSVLQVEVNILKNMKLWSHSCGFTGILDGIRCLTSELQVSF